MGPVRREAMVAAEDASQADARLVAAECAAVCTKLAAKSAGAGLQASVQAAIDVLCAMRDSGTLHASLVHMAFEAVSDDTLRLVFETVATHHLSYAGCVALVERALTPRVLALEQPASRALFATLEATLVRHPKAIVDGLLVPVFLREDIGPAQSEVVCRLLKEAVKPPFVEQFVQVLAERDLL
ncbi:hypothetical protein T492DRAFT_430391 [Pavlovales sp. CCMP2436]|nr:hypothetical protein T492DRAFT_430391 [Pavlovales sp. CCMP2436]